MHVTHKHTHLAVDLAAAQRGLNDIEQSICQSVALPHPTSRLLTCRAYIPVTHTHTMDTGYYMYVSVFAK